jgi:anaphase-promoting complex subunit 1
MAEEHLSTDYLDTLPTGLSLPIREALYLVRPSPPAAWTPEAHALIGRQDLSAAPIGAPAIVPPPPAALSAAADDTKDGILPFNAVSVLHFRGDARLTELHALLGAARPISVVAKSGAEGDLQEQQAALLPKVRHAYVTCFLPPYGARAFIGTTR